MNYYDSMVANQFKISDDGEYLVFPHPFGKGRRFETKEDFEEAKKYLNAIYQWFIPISGASGMVVAKYKLFTSPITILIFASITLFWYGFVIPRIIKNTTQFDA